MMSEKKITAAATVYAKETWSHDEDLFVCMDGFKEGAQWHKRTLLQSPETIRGTCGRTAMQHERTIIFHSLKPSNYA